MYLFLNLRLYRFLQQRSLLLLLHFIFQLLPHSELPLPLQVDEISLALQIFDLNLQFLLLHRKHTHLEVAVAVAVAVFEMMSQVNE